MSIRQSELKQLKKEYGIFAKVGNALYKVYYNLCRFVAFISLNITIFLIPVLLGLIVYNVLNFNAVRLVVLCVVLWVIINTNLKIQGG